MEHISNKKNYLYTLSSNVAKIVITSVIGLISIPMSLSYWQTDRYSIWLLINSVLVFLSVSNLGLNAAASILINKNSRDHEKITILKRAMFLAFLSVGLMLAILVGINYIYGGWVGLLGNIPNSLVDETKRTCIVVILFFLFNVPFSLITSAISGFYRQYVVNIFAIIGNIVSFIVLLYIISSHGNLVQFAFLTGLFSVVINIFQLLYFLFRIYLKADRTDREYGEDSAYRKIFITGIRCVIGSIAALVVSNTDNFVISHFLGVEHVAPYALTFKLFIIAYNFIYIFNSSIIPLIGKSIAKGDMEYSKFLYKRTFYLISWIGGGMWIGGVALFKLFIINYLGKDAFAGPMVLFFLGGYSYLFSIVNLENVMINTFNYIKGIVWIVWLEAIINITASIILLRYFGIGGVAMGTFIGTLLSPLILFPILLKKRSRGLISMDYKFILNQIVFVLVPLLTIAMLIQLNLTGIYINILSSFVVLVLYTFATYRILPSEIRIDIRLNWVHSSVHRKITKIFGKSN